MAHPLLVQTFQFFIKLAPPLTRAKSATVVIKITMLRTGANLNISFRRGLEVLVGVNMLSPPKINAYLTTLPHDMK